VFDHLTAGFQGEVRHSLSDISAAGSSYAYDPVVDLVKGLE